MKLYGHPSSGNVYKVQLMASLLGKELEHEPTSFADARGDAFRKLNPNGKVPVLVDGDFVLSESNAILCYLADGTSWLPEGKDRARTLQWLFWEQYEHEPTVAVARAMVHFAEPGMARDASLGKKQKAAAKALALLDGHLADRTWIVDGPTVADVSLFAYTNVAPEGGVDLDYPHIQSWLDRVRALPGFIPGPTS